MTCSTVTTSEHDVNGIKKTYVNADGYRSARLEEAYNNSISQEENHIKMAKQAMKMFGFSKILKTTKENDTTYVHDVE